MIQPLGPKGKFRNLFLDIILKRKVRDFVSKIDKTLCAEKLFSRVQIELFFRI